MKLDGFNARNFMSSAGGEMLYRLKNPMEFLSMSASTYSSILSYGFAAYNVGNAIYSCFTNDPVKRAKQRNYTLRWWRVSVMNKSRLILLIAKICLWIFMIIGAITTVLYAICEFAYWLLPPEFPTNDALHICFIVQYILILMLVISLILYRISNE